MLPEQSLLELEPAPLGLSTPHPQGGTRDELHRDEGNTVDLLRVVTRGDTGVDDPRCSTRLPSAYHLLTVFVFVQEQPADSEDRPLAGATTIDVRLEPISSGRVESPIEEVREQIVVGTRCFGPFAPDLLRRQAGLRGRQSSRFRLCVGAHFCIPVS